jgi:hypothetical protein
MTIFITLSPAGHLSCAAHSSPAGHLLRVAALSPAGHLSRVAFLSPAGHLSVQQRKKEEKDKQ